MPRTETNDEVINIMLDLETLGTRPGCKILSIGACIFDCDKRQWVASSFYQRASSDYQSRLTSDAATEDWWAKQDPEVRAEAFGGTEFVHVILGNFINWVSSFITAGKSIRIWSKGATFDVPIIEYALETYNMKAPWKFWEVACFRTLQDLGISLGIDADKFDGDKHNALHDAINQAAHAEKILSTLRAQVR